MLTVNFDLKGIKLNFKTKEMNYLEQEVTELPDSIETIFCKPLDEEGKRQPLSEIMMKLLIHVATCKQEGIDELYGKAKSEWALLSILEDRLGSLNCAVDKGPLVVMSMACKTPGECVMYANYIAYKAKKLEVSRVTINDFCMDIFPTGFFTDDTLSDHWDKQKVKSNGSDNLLDYLSAAESLIMK